MIPKDLVTALNKNGSRSRLTNSVGKADRRIFPDSKVHGADIGPTWVLSAPDGPHVDPMHLAIRTYLQQRPINNHWLVKPIYNSLWIAIHKVAEILTSFNCSCEVKYKQWKNGCIIGNKQFTLFAQGMVLKATNTSYVVEHITIISESNQSRGIISQIWCKEHWKTVCTICTD